MKNWIPLATMALIIIVVVALSSRRVSEARADAESAWQQAKEYERQADEARRRATLYMSVIADLDAKNRELVENGQLIRERSGEITARYKRTHEYIANTDRNGLADLIDSLLSIGHDLPTDGESLSTRGRVR